MESNLFSLASILLSTTYLFVQGCHLASAVIRAGRVAWRQRKLARKILSLSLFRRFPNAAWFVPGLSGAILGGAAVYLVKGWMPNGWSLWVILASALALEELRISRREVQSLAVLVLFERLRAACACGGDIFDGLARVVSDLPRGEVKRAVYEAIHRRRSGHPIELCLQPLQITHPDLSELVLTLRYTGFQNSPAIAVALNRLARRAGKTWDRTSRTLALKAQAQPWSQFGRAFALAGQGVGLLLALLNPTGVWLSYGVMVGMGLGLVVILFMFQHALAQTWLRRALAALLLLAGLVTPALATTRLNQPLIRVERVTHIPEPLPVDAFWAQIPVRAPTPLPSPPAASGYRHPTPMPDFTYDLPAPRTAEIPVDSPPIPEAELEDLCCHPLYQSR